MQTLTLNNQVKRKTTIATIKSFIRKNHGKIYIQFRSSFDGMQDCVVSCKSDFELATYSTINEKYTLGVEGAWFVGSSRDYFDDYQDETYIGYKVMNACGSFILAVRK